jgi:hypothetical protein
VLQRKRRSPPTARPELSIRHARRRLRPAPRFRPRLEELETRTVLSPASTTAHAAPFLTPGGGTTDGGPTTPVVYTPAQIRQAYQIDQAKLPNGQAATGAGQTIALIDAYHDPTITGDVQVFSNHFGLQAASVSVVSFTTTVDRGWATEEAIDTEWAHAVAPGANLLVVEAASNNLNDLLSAVQYASTHGANVVSMSWGTPEFVNESSYDAYFSTPGVTYVAAAGDNGTTQYPAVSPNVLGVGGTSLRLSSTNSYSSETTWSSTGGGLSAYEGEPSFQQGLQSTGKRSSPDVAYDADPNTGVYVYDTTGIGGWGKAGGTSVGAPQWAGVLALANQARAVNGLAPLGQGQVAIAQLPSADFHDITTGGNGTFTAQVGLDQVTGRGSPIVSSVVRDLAGAPQPPAPTKGGTPGPTTQFVFHAKRADVTVSIGASSTVTVTVSFHPTSAQPTAAASTSVNTATAQTLVTGLLGQGPSTGTVTLAAPGQALAGTTAATPGVFGASGFKSAASAFESPAVGGDNSAPQSDDVSAELTWQILMGRLQNQATPADGGLSIAGPEDDGGPEPFDLFELFELFEGDD